MAPCQSLFHEPHFLNISLPLFFPPSQQERARLGAVKKTVAPGKGVSSFLSKNLSGPLQCPGTRLPSRNKEKRGRRTPRKVQLRVSGRTSGTTRGSSEGRGGTHSQSVSNGKVWKPPERSLTRGEGARARGLGNASKRAQEPGAFSVCSS